MSLVQTGSQVTGTAAYIVVTGTADSSVSNIVEIVPVIGSMSGGNLTLTRSCDSCTSFVQFSGHFVNSKTVHATLTGGTPNGPASFRFYGDQAIGPGGPF